MRGRRGVSRMVCWLYWMLEEERKCGCWLYERRGGVERWVGWCLMVLDVVDLFYD